jgi:hypothetical protein
MSDWTGYRQDQEAAAKELNEARCEVWHDALAHQNGTQTSISFGSIPDDDNVKDFDDWLRGVVTREGGVVIENDTGWRISFADAA